MKVDVLSFDGVGIATVRKNGFKWGKAEKSNITTIDTSIPKKTIERHYGLDSGALVLLPKEQWRENVEERERLKHEFEKALEDMRKKDGIETDANSYVVGKAAHDFMYGTEIEKLDAIKNMAEDLFFKTRTPEQLAKIEADIKASLESTDGD